MIEIEARRKVAYDKGFEAGRAGKGMQDCPYRQTRHGNGLRSQWVDGFDAGVWRRCDDEGKIPVNLPFERVPQHASDPGFGPIPSEPDECPHGVRKEFRGQCVPCNTPEPEHSTSDAKDE